MQPLLIGVLAVVIYGLYLLQKALPCLYKTGENKLVSAILLFMVVTPLVLWLCWQTLLQRASFWVALPLLLLLLLWVGAGYLVEAYRRTKEKGRASGASKRQAAPADFMRNNTLTLAGGVLIWLYGAVFGVKDETIEILLLCLSSSLLAISLGSFWKYRKF